MECTLYLTDSCNMNCSYCYEGDTKNPSMLQEKTMFAALEFCTKHASTKEIDLVLLGGEPLLNKEMLIGAVKTTTEKYPEYTFNFSTTTNGTLCDSKILDFMNLHKFELSISIDGDAETHNLNRQSKSGKSLYTKTMDTLHILIKKRIPFITRMTVTCNNVHKLYDNIRYFFAMGIRKFEIATNEFEIWGAQNLHILDTQLSFIDKWYCTTVQNEELSIDFYDYKITTFMLGKKPKYCSAGTAKHITINSKGEIYPCGYVVNDSTWKLGDVFTGINGDIRLHNIRKSVIPKTPCTNCEINFACLGARCGFKNYRFTEKLNIPSENTCNLEKILYTHAEQVILWMYKVKHPKFIKFLQLATERNIEFSAWMKKVMEKEF